MFKRDGTPIHLVTGMVIDDVQIVLPLSAERMEELGITEVLDPVRPDDRFYWVSSSGIAEPKAVAMLTEGVLGQIKAGRQAALDSFAKSSGISAIYSENLLAAQRYTVGDATPMRGGETPTQYLTAMAEKMGFSVASFAAYILSENGLAARKAAAVEHVYLDFAYVRLPAATFEGIQTIVAEYQTSLDEALKTP